MTADIGVASKLRTNIVWNIIFLCNNPLCMELKEYKNNAIPITLIGHTSSSILYHELITGAIRNKPTYRINATKRLSVVNVDTSISDRSFFWTTAADSPHCTKIPR